MGGFNGGFRWRDALDEPARYEVTLSWAHRGDKVKTPVTLRRCQKFRPAPGRTYAWVNRSPDGKTVFQQGDVTVGADGLLTLADVEFHQAGSRLIVTPKQD